MKSQNSSRSYRSWIAGILLSIACVLFISSHIHDRWSTASSSFRHHLALYDGIWYRRMIYPNTTVSFKIRCLNERIPCTNVFIARIFMIATCITSGIGAVILCIFSIFKIKYKPILCLTGLCLAILSFIFGMIGFVFGLIWVLHIDRDMISSAAISVLIGSLLSFASAVCVFIINLNESI